MNSIWEQNSYQNLWITICLKYSLATWISKKGNNFEDDIQAGRLVKSSIIEKNGNKYGIIGATASDMLDTISIDSKEDCVDIDFMNLEQTTTAIQEEINKLKQQGINKIILISHLGIEAD